MSNDSNLDNCQDANDVQAENLDACWECLGDDDPDLAILGTHTGPVLSIDQLIEQGDSKIYKITLPGCWTTTPGSAFIKGGFCAFTYDTSIPTIDENSCQGGDGDGDGDGGNTGGGGDNTGGGGEAQGGGNGVSGSGCGSSLMPANFHAQVVGTWLTLLLTPGAIVAVIRRKSTRG